ncbi:NACHT domain-containing protein [Hassallia byssoidea VB512170]|uniref:NACHT domain-containing protein n=1 Tax=Hassallia byssoidea VB512170 TaxID=1304833 RepID=A0A846HFA9_9CYAN|nr:NB-ARC domain-containing protein [Hassalia byssoidea]NEU76002.1 NACHT domain-containing protein [Hassalia byssoidea VB512170]
MTANLNKIEEDFIEAKNNWELEKLYVDLASAKGKALTPVEKKFLRGLLCGFSPAEIANAVYKSRSSSTVRVYLSNGLYKYIEDMLSNQEGSSIKVKNWSRVTQLLEKAGYKKGWFQIDVTNNQIITTEKNKADFDTMKTAQRHNWGEAIDVSKFYGRTSELASLSEWIVQERCRLVVLLGMGGIGKTALSVKLAEAIKENFEFVIWRSLNLAPPLEVILNQLISLLSPEAQTQSTESVESNISQLIECLRSSRCLIVLDGVDSILSNSNDTDLIKYPTMPASNPVVKNPSGYVMEQIRYLKGYENYGELIRRLGDSQHQSCLVLTSREKPQEIAALQGKKLPVRSWKLTGLSNAESWQILKEKGFTDSDESECRVLIEWYAGNPLFLKLVATTIQELFAGNIYEFLEQGTVVFGDIRAILDEQFYRLSNLEKQIMHWLALNRNLVSVRKLQKEIIPRVSQRLILEAIELLQRRSLIERQASGFAQTPVLMEYIAERLIEENFKNQDKSGYSLMSQTIFEAQLKNHIREIRLNAEM